MSVLDAPRELIKKLVAASAPESIEAVDLPEPFDFGSESPVLDPEDLAPPPPPPSPRPPAKRRQQDSDSPDSSSAESGDEEGEEEEAEEHISAPQPLVAPAPPAPNYWYDQGKVDTLFEAARAELARNTPRVLAAVNANVEKFTSLLHATMITAGARMRQQVDPLLLPKLVGMEERAIGMSVAQTRRLTDVRAIATGNAPYYPDLTNWRKWPTVPEARRLTAAFQLCYLASPPCVPTHLLRDARTDIEMHPFVTLMWACNTLPRISLLADPFSRVLFTPGAAPRLNGRQTRDILTREVLRKDVSKSEQIGLARFCLVLKSQSDKIAFVQTAMDLTSRIVIPGMEATAAAAAVAAATAAASAAATGPTPPPPAAKPKKKKKPKKIVEVEEEVIAEGVLDAEPAKKKSKKRPASEPVPDAPLAKKRRIEAPGSPLAPFLLPLRADPQTLPMDGRHVLADKYTGSPALHWSPALQSSWRTIEQWFESGQLDAGLQAIGRPPDWARGFILGVRAAMDTYATETLGKREPGAAAPSGIQAIAAVGAQMLDSAGVTGDAVIPERSKLALALFIAVGWLRLFVLDGAEARALPPIPDSLRTSSAISAPPVAAAAPTPVSVPGVRDLFAEAMEVDEPPPPPPTPLLTREEMMVPIPFGEEDEGPYRLTLMMMMTVMPASFASMHKAIREFRAANAELLLRDTWRLPRTTIAGLSRSAARLQNAGENVQKVQAALAAFISVVCKSMAGGPRPLQMPSHLEVALMLVVVFYACLPSEELEHRLARATPAFAGLSIGAKR